MAFKGTLYAKAAVAKIIAFCAKIMKKQRKKQRLSGTREQVKPNELHMDFLCRYDLRSIHNGSDSSGAR